jgi:hypothetical protein
MNVEIQNDLCSNIDDLATHGFLIRSHFRNTSVGSRKATSRVRVIVSPPYNLSDISV